jgi:hypothetical protein
MDDAPARVRALAPSAPVSASASVVSHSPETLSAVPPEAAEGRTPAHRAARAASGRAPAGQLFRYRRHTLDLADLGERDFDFLEGDSQFRVRYDAGFFRKLATWDRSSLRWVPLEPERIDVAALGGWLNLWSPSLGGSVSYVHGDSFVSFFAETKVDDSDPLFDSAGGGRVALYGYLDCPGGNLSRAQIDRGDVFLPIPAERSSPHAYQLERESLVLWCADDGAEGSAQLVAAGPARGETPLTEAFRLRSGPLFTDVSGIRSLSELWSQPEFYCYELEIAGSSTTTALR